MIRQLKKITRQIVAGANVATILMMLMIGYTGRVNPVDHPFIASFGLAFPIFMSLNLCFLIFWLIFKPKWALIPFFGFVICYGPVRTYFPMNVGHDVPEGSIKVLSYNVWRFATWDKSSDGSYPIVNYIKEQDADIVCLQESSVESDSVWHYVDSTLSNLYQYRDTAMNWYCPDCVSLYSRFPIVGRERIRYASVGNLSMAWKLKIGNDTVLVVNNHLETSGLSAEDRDQFKNIVNGNLEGISAKEESHRILSKLAASVLIRAPQADAISRYISLHSGMSVICCGDFNDNPLSYTRRTIAKNLTDCYVASGNGPGISYHKGGFYVRIDNIFCSSDWQPYGCKVDSKIKQSDHYPIYCWLKKRSKP